MTEKHAKQFKDLKVGDKLYFLKDERIESRTIKKLTKIKEGDTHFTVVICEPHTAYTFLAMFDKVSWHSGFNFGPDFNEAFRRWEDERKKMQRKIEAELKKYNNETKRLKQYYLTQKS